MIMCVRDIHTFLGPAVATHEVKRLYDSGQFHVFCVCDKCLSDIYAAANKYKVNVSVSKITD